MERMRLEGKRAVVTGAAGGIGGAIARGLADEGAAVACLDLHEDGVRDVARSLSARGARAWGWRCDVTDPADVDEAAARSVELMGGIDILCANAGGSQGETIPFLDLDLDTFRRMIDRNLTSVFLCCSAFGRQMAKDGGGAIVVTSSQLAEIARPGMGHYAAAKGGVKQLVKAMAVDLASVGIRVNAMAPGPTLTPGNKEMFERPEVRDANLRTIPLGRIAEPDEMVGAVIYLASDEASFTTGTTLLVDGGYTIL
jgi:NAD(P)-dependent dehydrogenase (short-subunit alcohol dehydrogenase family)